MGPDVSHSPAAVPSAAAAAVARFDARPTTWRRVAARMVGTASRLLMLGLNQVEVSGAPRLRQALAGERGLLTFSNHVSLFDDPLLTACLVDPPWERLRWVAADSLNFFGSSWKAALFNAGKCVPIVRGAGVDQPGMDFLAARLAAGDWVHVFPEGGRTRDPEALLRRPLKAGLAHLVRAARPRLLPFAHRGMHEVLPIGARLPRISRRVTVRIGELHDSAEGLATSSLEAITAWAEARLLELQRHLVAGPPGAQPSVKRQTTV